ncbi:galactosyl transferase [Gordonia phage GMA2]|uniref:Glycosyltransferase n=1 Tax=Gordonia phage GMA2 TaxID=1647283 RepID=A0A0K0N6V1_9CAUD|nr:galactosyl transferase [Gordonia phage GMA2]AKJ72560.1 hypothetical protein GMA2_22 [Gordonia phage GMA2]
MLDATIIIPFRDRGSDPLRAKNLERVLEHWRHGGYEVLVVDDGRTADEQFNRSAAYNKGAEQANSEVLIYTESDMLLPMTQIRAAVEHAQQSQSLIVPFTDYFYLSEKTSQAVRDHEIVYTQARPESVMGNGASIGAVNVVTKSAVEKVGGWDEAFEGNWYDDNAMKIAFEICCGQVQWVPGIAYHLYHLPGWKGDHLTEEDRLATERNHLRFEMYKKATTSEEVRELTKKASSSVAL